MIDIQDKKTKILSILESGGPSIPVRISKAIGMDPVFASALLAELLSAKTIKMSNMKIGASPMYLIPGQEQRLEEHIGHLKSGEKEAYIKLKERKLLSDEEEAPAIRVALRNLKDFASAFKFKDKIMWRYTFTPQEEIQKILDPEKKKSPKKIENENEETSETKRDKVSHDKSEEVEEISVEKTEESKEESKTIEPIFNKREEKEPKENNQSFLEEIESFLKNQNTEIVAIEEVDKKKVIARIKTENREALLFAFNKKRINEQELMKCYKKSKAVALSYKIIVRGDLTKKMNETIDACKKLLGVDSLD